MDDQKDRFGDKIRELEKAREDQWARERDRQLLDRQLLEKIRARQHWQLGCPRCSAQLVRQAGGDLTIMACPNGHGAWLEEAPLARLSESTKLPKRDCHLN
jgi:hypothetical protein